MKISLTLNANEPIPLTDLVDALEPWTGDYLSERCTITPFIDHDSDTIELQINVSKAKGE